MVIDIRTNCRPVLTLAAALLAIVFFWQQVSSGYSAAASDIQSADVSELSVEKPSMDGVDKEPIPSLFIAPALAAGGPVAPHDLTISLPWITPPDIRPPIA